MKKPRLDITSRIAPRTAEDEDGAEYVEFEVNDFADLLGGECAICGQVVSNGWRCETGEEFHMGCVNYV